MRWRQAPRIACVVLLGGFAALGAAENSALFPESAGPLEPDVSTKLRLPSGKTLFLDFVRFKPITGLSKAAIPYVCGVVLRQAAAGPQALLAVGIGRTSFWTCDGLSENGLAKTKDGGWTIALIYNTSTPGNISTASVVLVPDSSGHFHVDDTLADRSDITTLNDLRRILTRMTP